MQACKHACPLTSYEHAYAYPHAQKNAHACSFQQMGVVIHAWSSEHATKHPCIFMRACNNARPHVLIEYECPSDRA